MSVSFLQEILRWLSPAILSILMGELLLYFRNGRGNGVLVYRISEQYWFRISGGLLSRLLKIGRRRVSDELVWNKVRIINTSNALIEDVNLTLYLHASQGVLKFWAAELVDPLGVMTWLEDKDSLTLTGAFINPRRLHKKEKITLYILSNTKLHFSLTGGGRNWCAEYEDRSLPVGHAKLIWLGMLVAMILSFAIFALSNSTHFRGSTLLASLGVLATSFDIAMVFLLAGMIRRNQRARRVEHLGNIPLAQSIPRAQ